MNCTKCGCEIIGGFYNRPSGVQCTNCGGMKENRAELITKMNNSAPSMLKLIFEMNKYLDTKQKGQINSINTGSIFHHQLKEIIEKLS